MMSTWWSKHIQAWNKRIVKQRFSASSWLITKINLLQNFNTEATNRCFEAGTFRCAANYIYPKPNENKFKILDNSNFNTGVLFRPQKVHLKLHVGECLLSRFINRNNN